jgi:hypothetical protein
MRDFYDVYVLTQYPDLDANIFTTALNKTAEKRGTTKQMSAGVMINIDFIMGNEQCGFSGKNTQRNTSMQLTLRGNGYQCCKSTS